MVSHGAVNRIASRLLASHTDLAREPLLREARRIAGVVAALPGIDGPSNLLEFVHSASLV